MLNLRDGAGKLKASFCGSLAYSILDNLKDAGKWEPFLSGGGKTVSCFRFTKGREMEIKNGQGGILKVYFLENDTLTNDE